MFYKKVEAFCKKSNIAISAFEKKCGLGNGTIGGWAEGARPRIDSLEKVSIEMGITLAELLTSDQDT